MLPPFSIQTLVENSVRHAGEKRLEGVSVQVNAFRRNSDLIIEVADDGPGFDPDALKTGHGLDTLLGRLRALYGDRASLQFKRMNGMCVCLTVTAA